MQNKLKTIAKSDERFGLSEKNERLDAEKRLLFSALQKKVLILHCQRQFRNALKFCKI